MARPIRGRDAIGSCARFLDARTPAIDQIRRMMAISPANIRFRRVLRCAARPAIALILLATLLAVVVPFRPNMPSAGIDPSWQYALNEALACGFAFGRDVVFTFGPYASMYTRSYSPATDSMMIWGCVVWCLGLTALLLGLAKNSSLAWLLLFVVLVLVLPYSPDALLFFCVLATGLTAYALATMNVIAQTSGYRRAMITLLATAYAMLGFLALTKASVLLGIIPTALIASVMLALGKSRRLASLPIICPAVGMVIGWIAAGQDIAALPVFIHRLIPVISGYSDAMSLGSGLVGPIIYATAGALIAFASFDRVVPVSLSICKVLIVLVVLFLGFKAGFVRQDAHVIRAGVLIALVAVALPVVTRGRTRYAAVLVGLAACIVIVRPYVDMRPSALVTRAANVYEAAFSGFIERIRHHGALTAKFAAANAALRKQSQLPKVNGSVDIYPWDQSYLLASGNRWSPRPIPQSYSAYTPRLEVLNAEHLRSPTGPGYVFFKVETIDRRMPSLEDGRSWPTLFSDFQPRRLVGGFLVLKRMATPDTAPSFHWGVSRPFNFGEWITVLPQQRDLAFARMEINKTLVGRVVSLLFKLPPVYLHLRLRDGRRVVFRIIPGMAKAGFLLSPLVTNVMDFVLVYDTPALSANRRVQAFMLTTDKGGRGLWSRRASIQFAPEIAVRHEDVESIVGFDRIVDVPGAPPYAVGACQGNMDVINGRSGETFSGTLSPVLSMRGWLAASVPNEAVPRVVFVTLTNSATGRVTFIASRRTPRPDVNRYFNKPSMPDVGFKSVARLDVLAPGEYTVGLAYLDDGKVKLCKQFHQPGSVGSE